MPRQLDTSSRLAGHRTSSTGYRYTGVVACPSGAVHRWARRPIHRTAAPQWPCPHDQVVGVQPFVDISTWVRRGAIESRDALDLPKVL